MGENAILLIQQWYRTLCWTWKGQNFWIIAIVDQSSFCCHSLMYVVGNENSKVVLDWIQLNYMHPELHYASQTGFHFPFCRTASEFGPMGVWVRGIFKVWQCEEKLGQVVIFWCDIYLSVGNPIPNTTTYFFQVKVLFSKGSYCYITRESEACGIDVTCNANRNIP